MTTQTATEFVLMTREQLDQLVAETKSAMLEAWRIQSRTTVDDGYTMDEALTATRNATQRQADFNAAWNMRECYLMGWEPLPESEPADAGDEDEDYSATIAELRSGQF